MTTHTYTALAETLNAKTNNFAPQVALVLGSGLGFLAEQVEDAIIVPYSDVPGMSVALAPGHAGNFVFGTLEGKRVAMMQGRPHYYEGNCFHTVVAPLRALKLVGAETMIVTNAAGGVNTDFNIGDLMLITDHIKLFDESPLRGANIAELGDRFPDMTYTYTPQLQELARQVAAENSVNLREGVYMFFPGPQYETPAEVRAARILGADAVGMSTVPEVIAAAHAGYNILGVSVISNMAAGVLPVKLHEQEVIDVANAARPMFTKLVLGCLRGL